MTGTLRRTWTLFELAWATLATVRGRTTFDTLPAPSAMARLQATALRADGLPRLAARFMSSYTGISAEATAPADELSRRLLRADLRLLTTVGRAAGFAVGQDMDWIVDCANVLAADALADQAVRAAPVHMDGSFGPDIAHYLLHLMGQEHLVSGRYDPAALRTVGPPAATGSAAMRRLREGTVAMLAALASDAQSADPSWDSFCAALWHLGLSPKRASRLGPSFGSLTQPAARHLRVSTQPRSSGRTADIPEIPDHGGMVMAISDLVAISSLLQ
jgi:hypothetical protein